MIFVDSNVPMHLVGAAHPHKADAQRLLEQLIARSRDIIVATDRKGLSRVFGHIDRMRPARFEPGGTVPMDFFLPFALVALGGLGLHLVGLLGLRYTPW